ncbi:MAG: TetR/AcrR family transcriptional regulator [Myxococcales bacterium]|nr:TetR/AcrR family transcriptional regulator [Myxococcales bacterium]
MSDGTSRGDRISDKGGKYHHGDLRDSLIHAALELVETQGVGGLSLRAAARRAGVSHAAPYRHFKDKEALLAAAAEQGYRELGNYLQGKLDKLGEGKVERVQGLAQAYVEFARQNTPQFRLMFGPSIPDKTIYPELQKASGDAFRLVMQATKEAYEAGDLTGPSYQQVGMSAWALTHGIASLYVDRQFVSAGMSGDDAESAIEWMFAIFLAGAATEK